jgi:hypothetical protein
MGRRLLAVVIVSIAAVSSAGASTEGSPGVWTRVTDANGRNIDEVGLARTSDGVLHVVWERRKGALNESIMHTPVSLAGKVGSASPVLEGLKAAGNPDLVRLPDGRLRAFFPGLGETNADGGVKAATAPASGVGWTREGIRVSSTVSTVSPAGATLTKQGESVFAYSMSLRLAFHVGLDPAVAETEIQPDNKCCDYFPGLATDTKGGQTVITWYSNADGRTGIWAQQILPSRGPRTLAPGSAQGGKSLGIDQQAAIEARLGAPGVYLAYCSGYPTCKRALLWRVGGAPRVAGSGQDIEDVNIAAAPEGRLWVMWHDGRSKQLFATRSNKAATRFGPRVRIKPPGGTSAVWKLKGEGTRGRLDLLAAVSTGSSLATWHTQVLPPLSIGAKKRAASVTFTVSDAGDPVSGAAVTYAGKTLATNAKGQATAPLAARKTKATAGKAGYRGAAVSVTP